METKFFESCDNGDFKGMALGAINIVKAITPKTYLINPQIWDHCVYMVAYSGNIAMSLMLTDALTLCGLHAIESVQKLYGIMLRGYLSSPDYTEEGLKYLVDELDDLFPSMYDTLITMNLDKERFAKIAHILFSMHGVDINYIMDHKFMNLITPGNEWKIPVITGYVTDDTDDDQEEENDDDMVEY